MRRREPFVGLIFGMLFSLAPLGVYRAGAQNLPAGLVVGQASGFGEIGIAPGRVGSFSFRLDARTAGLLVPGQVQFIDRVTGEKVVSQRITSGFIAPNQVFVEGLCTVDGRPGVFRMQASAARALGQRDTFFLCYTSPFSSACFGDFLLSGRVTIRA